MSTGGQGKLSKEEVEALLQATKEEAPPEEKAEPVRRVEGYSFLQPSRFSKSQLEGLRRINDSLAQNAGRQVSRLLRTSAQVQLVSMDHIKWDSLLGEVGDSVVAFVFQMNPLGCQGIIAAESQLALACLDRMLGGLGEGSDPTAAPFTDLDVRVLAAFVRAFLDPLPELWERIGEFQVELGPFVMDLQSLDLFTGNEDLVQLCFLVQSSAGSGQVTLSVPFQAVRSLPPGDDEEGFPVVPGDQTTANALCESLKQMTVELTVLLGAANLTVARLVRAVPGDIVVLDRRVGDALEVRVNDRVKFRGHPGVSKRKRAVRLITEE